MVLISTAISTQAATLDEISMWNKQRKKQQQQQQAALTQYLYICTSEIQYNRLWMYRRQSADWNRQKHVIFFLFVPKCYLQNIIITGYKEIQFLTPNFQTQTHISSAKFVFTFHLIWLLWSCFLAFHLVFSASVSVVWLLIHHRSSVFCCLFFCDCRYFSEAPEVLLTHYIVKLNINVVRAHVIPSFYFCTTCINHCLWCVVWFSCHFCCCLIATQF